MYRHFEDELEDIKNSVLKMSYHVTDQIIYSLKALEKKDLKAAERVIEKDALIDEMEILIDEKCTELILRHHPLAKDLRFVLGTLKLNNDLERIGDLAVDIAQRAQEISQYPNLKPYEDLPKLGETVLSMLKNSLEAFTENDYEKAKKVILSDSQVDILRDKITIELSEKIVKSDPSKINVALPLILAARHLERIGDHCVNIAEDIIYMISAKVVKHHHAEF